MQRSNQLWSGRYQVRNFGGRTERRCTSLSNPRFALQTLLYPNQPSVFLQMPAFSPQPTESKRKIYLEKH
mgnify:FL=1